MQLTQKIVINFTETCWISNNIYIDIKNYCFYNKSIGIKYFIYSELNGESILLLTVHKRINIMQLSYKLNFNIAKRKALSEGRKKYVV